MGVDINSVMVFGWRLNYDQCVKVIKYHLSQVGEDAEVGDVEDELEDPSLFLDIFGVKSLEFELERVNDHTWNLGIWKDEFTMADLRTISSCESFLQCPVLKPICDLLGLDSEPSITTFICIS